MKTQTGKIKNGKVYKGFYTNSCMPNQKPKRVRVRKNAETTNEKINIKVDVNMIGVAAACLTFIYIPLDVAWQIGIAILFILSSIHMEVDKSE